MSMQQIALVPEGVQVSAVEIARLSAALQKQVTRDLSPLWGVTASITVFPTLEDVPFDYWPIVIGDTGARGNASVQRDDRGQPYAHVAFTRGWTVSASRVCLEMLTNPYGARTLTAASPRASQGSVAVLLEVCAPCAGMRHAYLIDDVLVSDFCTPAYFGASLTRAGESLSVAGGVTEPLQVLEGGHLAWYEPGAGAWWIRNFWGEHCADTEIGRLATGTQTPRELVQSREPRLPLPQSFEAQAAEAQARFVRDKERAGAQNRAFRLRVQLQAEFDDAAAIGREADENETTLWEVSWQGAAGEVQELAAVGRASVAESGVKQAVVTRAEPSRSSRPPLPQRAPRAPVVSSIAPAAHQSAEIVDARRRTALRGVIGVAAAFGLVWVGHTFGSAPSHSQSKPETSLPQANPVVLAAPPVEAPAPTSREPAPLPELQRRSTAAGSGVSRQKPDVQPAPPTPARVREASAFVVAPKDAKPEVVVPRAAPAPRAEAPALTAQHASEESSSKDPIEAFIQTRE